MSTGPQRLFRCRVRDLASCFYACRLPLEEDQPDNSCSKSPKTSGGGIVLDFDGGALKMSTADKIRGESVVVHNSLPSSHREPRFAEEEYIVFCFKEDGEIDMVNEETSAAVNSRKEDTQNSEQSENLGKKDKENEAARVPNEEPNSSKIESGRIPADESNPSKMDSSQLNRVPLEESNPNKMKLSNRFPVEESNSNKMEATRLNRVPLEESDPNKMERWDSSDSNRSDTTSTSSFAFPVLGIEWIGSPVHMPKSEKQSVSLHCCRF